MSKYQITTLWDGAPTNNRVNLTIEAQDQVVQVSVDAPFWGDAAPDAPPGRTWELWEFEVVELFIAGPQTDYLELEFGPHGHYVALLLAGERNIIEEDILIESYTAQIKGDRWHGSATFKRSLLPPGPYRFNAYAMHGLGEQRAHYALFPLPGDAPDFHTLASFRSLDGLDS